MSDVVIHIEGLGKQYSIQHESTANSSGTLRELRVNRARGLFGRGGASGLVPRSKASQEKVWVLQDIDLDIERGEVVGIIGRNGAGKSTLLKILSRITDPTLGRATVRGRVASLLEVGTGFHSELTGRENIFLNGSILGMSQEEIRGKFDEIVAFSGVEKYLDTPVKRYSSGMYVRLAFAVASHLEPDILIVDEVLAVGDMDFQRKCLGRMNEVSKQGRTVLFVSHNLPMVSSLCNQCVLLEGGRLVTKGATADVLPLYHGASFTQTRKPVNGAGTVGSGSVARSRVGLSAAWITDQRGKAVDQLSLFDDVFLHVRYEVTEDVSDSVVPFFHVFDEKGDYVLLTFPHDWPQDSSRLAGTYEAVCHIPAHFLNDGLYSVSVQVNTVTNGHTLEFFEHHVVRFTVMDDILTNPHRAHTKYSYQHPGVVRPLLDWTLDQKSGQSEVES
jgi:lipopolysaccharide transport system ATP-binding protein